MRPKSRSSPPPVNTRLVGPPVPSPTIAGIFQMRLPVPPVIVRVRGPVPTKSTELVEIMLRVASAPETSIVPPAAPRVSLNGWLWPAAAANVS